MAIIILNKSKCSLCHEIMKDDEELKGFPAFLPYDHKFGRYSDAIMHQACFVKENDHMDVDDMLTAYRMIIDSRPQGLKSIAEIDSWTKMAFEGWPPKNGVVIFQPLFADESEEGGFWADKDSWEEFEKIEKEEQGKIKARREEAYRRDAEALQYARDDD